MALQYPGLPGYQDKRDANSRLYADPVYQMSRVMQPGQQRPTAPMRTPRPPVTQGTGTKKADAQNPASVPVSSKPSSQGPLGYLYGLFSSGSAPRAAAVSDDSYLRENRLGNPAARAAEAAKQAAKQQAGAGGSAYPWFNKQMPLGQAYNDPGKGMMVAPDGSVGMINRETQMPRQMGDFYGRQAPMMKPDGDGGYTDNRPPNYVAPAQVASNPAAQSQGSPAPSQRFADNLAAMFPAAQSPVAPSPKYAANLAAIAPTAAAPSPTAQRPMTLAEVEASNLSDAEKNRLGNPAARAAEAAKRAAQPVAATGPRPMTLAEVEASNLSDAEKNRLGNPAAREAEAAKQAAMVAQSRAAAGVPVSAPAAPAEPVGPARRLAGGGVVAQPQGPVAPVVVGPDGLPVQRQGIIGPAAAAGSTIAQGAGPSNADMARWGVSPRDVALGQNNAYGYIGANVGPVTGALMRAQEAQRIDPDSAINLTTTQGERDAAMQNSMEARRAEQIAAGRYNPTSESDRQLALNQIYDARRAQADAEYNAQRAGYKERKAESNRRLAGYDPNALPPGFSPVVQGGPASPGSLQVMGYKDNEDGTTQQLLSNGQVDIVRHTQNPDGAYGTEVLQENAAQIPGFGPMAAETARLRGEKMRNDMAVEGAQYANYAKNSRAAGAPPMSFYDWKAAGGANDLTTKALKADALATRMAARADRDQRAEASRQQMAAYNTARNTGVLPSDPVQRQQIIEQLAASGNPYAADLHRQNMVNARIERDRNTKLASDKEARDRDMVMSIVTNPANASKTTDQLAYLIGQARSLVNQSQGNGAQPQQSPAGGASGVKDIPQSVVDASIRAAGSAPADEGIEGKAARASKVLESVSMLGEDGKPILPNASSEALQEILRRNGMDELLQPEKAKELYRSILEKADAAGRADVKDVGWYGNGIKQGGSAKEVYLRAKQEALRPYIPVLELLRQSGLAGESAASFDYVPSQYNDNFNPMKPGLEFMVDPWNAGKSMFKSLYRGFNYGS